MPNLNDNQITKPQGEIMENTETTTQQTPAAEKTAVTHVVHNNDSSKHEHTAYTKLLLLSEMNEDDLIVDECLNAEHAMTRILKCGTCNDVAKAIKYYVNFLMGK